MAYVLISLNCTQQMAMFFCCSRLPEPQNLVCLPALLLYYLRHAGHVRDVKFAVCLSVWDASPSKLLNEFGWHSAQGRRSVPGTASCISVVFAPKMWFSYVYSSQQRFSFAAIILKTVHMIGFSRRMTPSQFLTAFLKLLCLSPWGQCFYKSHWLASNRQ